MTKEKISRNDKCPCGSGLKYKKCCLDKKTMFDIDIFPKKDINATFQYINSHESEHILNILIGLQLTPENHGKNIRIEELAKHLVQNLNNGQPANFQELKSHLDSEYAYSCMEDIPTNLFCENIVFFGGNYTAFPGIVTHSIEAFRNLTEIVFAQSNNLPKNFKQHVYQGITLILCMGQLLANRVGIRGNINILENDNRKFNYKFSSKNFAITQNELSQILLNNKIKPDIINDFIISPQDNKFQSKDPDLNPLLYYPIIKFNDKYFFVMISNQIGTINEYILRLSEKYNCNKELVKIYHNRIWHALWGACDKMHWGLIDIKLPKNKISNNLKERIFQFDVNRLAYVCYFHNSKTTDRYTESDSKEVPLNVLKSRLKEIVTFLKTDNLLRDYQFFTLVTYESMGRYMLVSIDAPQENEFRLPFSAFYLIQLSDTEKWDSLSLWKFAKSYDNLLQYTRIPPLIDTLDMYSIYKAKDESFCFSDEEKPNFLVVTPGDGSRLIKESKIEQNLHGAIANINNQIVYIPVIKSIDYAPLYEPQHSIGYYALCLEISKLPIWITNKQIKDKQMFVQIRNYAESIGFWLYKLQDEIRNNINAHINFPLEIELFLDNEIFENISAQELQNIDTKIPAYSFDYNDHKIKFHIHASSLSTLSGSNNDGERKMMIEVLNSFNQIEDINFSNEFIHNAIDNAIPFGKAKMILMYNTQNDLQMDNRWLAKPLFISKSETNMLLDELSSLIEQNSFTIPKKIESMEKKRDFFNLAIKVLFKKLAEEIQVFDYEYLLDILINIHETLIWKREFDKIIIPAQLLCFGDIENKIEEIQVDEKNLVKTTLSLRCLIEYLAALPTQGTIKAGYDDIDRLLVLMYEIINYGFLSDSVHLEMSDPKVGKLKSGRVGISSEFVDEKIKPFTEAYTKETVDNYIQHFDSHFEFLDLPDELEANAMQDEDKNIDEAFLKDWGIEYFNITKFCYTCALLCIKIQSSVTTMKEEDFIKSLQAEEINLPKQEIIAGLNHFSLENRPDYLKAPDGFNNNEVFPWKYNREFSFGRRFIVKYSNKNGDILLKWGFRNALAAERQLSLLLFGGRLRNGGKEINKLLGIFRKRKGGIYRNEVRDWLKKYSELIVIDHEVKIAPNEHLKADKDYGDIDILVYNKNTKTVISLECKNTTKAKNIHEMKTEMDNYLGRDGQQGMIQKHLARHNWLKQHMQDVRIFLNTKETVQIKSYILTSEVIPTTYIKSQELSLPILSYYSLKKEGLKIFEKE
jgi:hypothetical protein